MQALSKTPAQNRRTFCGMSAESSTEITKPWNFLWNFSVSRRDEQSSINLVDCSEISAVLFLRKLRESSIVLFLQKLHRKLHGFVSMEILQKVPRFCFCRNSTENVKVLYPVSWLLPKCYFWTKSDYWTKCNYWFFNGIFETYNILLHMM